MSRAGILVLAALVATPSVVEAQRFPGSGSTVIHNVPYNGQFTFVRLRFNPIQSWSTRGDPKWNHDYPRAERNFMRLISELTAIQPYLDGGNVLSAEDPELFLYPVAYVSEPGFWTVNDEERENLRAYLLKGGFMIFDDFVGQGQWSNFERVLREVLPDARLVRLDVEDRVFDSFFHIESLEFPHPNFGVEAEFWGVYEDNDSNKRLMLIANYNNDIGDYWEWSDQGFLPIELSNEAYKLGINYLVYAMTH